MLNHEEIIKHLQRITKIKSFINEYNWKGTNYPSEKGDWKIFEKNNLTVAINVLYSKKEITYSAYVSKHNSNREKQFILLMISNGGIIQKKKWLFLLFELSSFFQNEKQLNHIKKYVKIKILSSEETEILKFKYF